VVSDGKQTCTDHQLKLLLFGNMIENLGVKKPKNKQELKKSSEKFGVKKKVGKKHDHVFTRVYCRTSPNFIQFRFHRGNDMEQH
jgi:hypothetical protein